MPKHSDKQTALLQKLGVPVPPSEASASRLISYLLKGNGMRGGATQFERAATFNRSWTKWVGKRVWDHGDRRQGLVIAVRVKTPGELLDEKFRRKLLDKGEDAALPFELEVRWDGETRSKFCSMAGRRPVEATEGEPEPS